MSPGLKDKWLVPAELTGFRSNRFSPGSISGLPSCGVATAVAFLIGGCSPPVPPLPAEPSSFVYTQRYAYGDRLRNRDVQAYVDAYDLLEPTYGKFRQGGRGLPASVPPEAVQRELAARLEPQGWEPVPELNSWPRYNGSYAFGWRKGKSVYAIVGLKHDRSSATSPVNIITNIPGETSYVARPGA